MKCDPPFTRRLLLGRGLGAALMLPAVAQAGPASRPSRRVGRLPLVMLDPGHGGKDPGAIGVSGTYEKHVALAVAEDLRSRLLASGRFRIGMTREVDDFIPLDDRVDLAQAHGAALFVSIHADALSNQAVRGASVYTLATSASDAQTAALAGRENSADRYGAIVSASLSPHVAQILASLVRHETRMGSARLQRSVVNCLGERLPLLENPARHAAFAVLKAADIPSVLVEMGFMSNPRDEAALRLGAHRETIAQALHLAIERYFTAQGQLTSIG
jgi:N-acetylmuramoyl-L-alanine amidase